MNFNCVIARFNFNFNYYSSFNVQKICHERARSRQQKKQQMKEQMKEQTISKIQINISSSLITYEWKSLCFYCGISGKWCNNILLQNMNLFQLLVDSLNSVVSMLSSIDEKYLDDSINKLRKFVIKYETTLEFSNIQQARE